MRPILEVMVGKTVEQALLEVMEEEELASLRQQQVCESVCGNVCVYIALCVCAHIMSMWVCACVSHV